MDVSIIIVNYNTRQMTQDCIDSLKRHTTDVKYEIILVDNASKDGSVEFFSKENDIIFVPCKENLGFGRANNAGAQYASGKYLFLLNSDTLVLNNAVKLFFEYMEGVPETEACCGCILQNKEGKEIHSYGDFHTLCNCIDERVLYGLCCRLGFPHKIRKYDNPKYRTGKSFRVQFVTGADLFIRKSVADKCGLFDSDFFMYSEDMEMQRRYSKHGFFSSIVVGPKIVHLVGGSNAKKPLSKAEMMIESIFIYEKKTQSRLGYWWFRIIFKSIYCLFSLFFRHFTIREKLCHFVHVIKLKP